MFSRALLSCVRLSGVVTQIKPAPTILRASFGQFRRPSPEEQKRKEEPKSRASDKPINESITLRNMRVVYEEDGESKWELLSRSMALALARSKALDLVLVDANSDPPVCKLENYREKKIARARADRTRLKTNKVRLMKEFIIGVACAPHDLNTIMNKAKNLMSKGHPIKFSIVAKRQTKKSGHKEYMDNPTLAIEEMTLKVLELVEGLDIVIQHAGKIESSSGEVDEKGFIPIVAAKREIILSMKIDKKNMAKKVKKATELLESEESDNQTEKEIKQLKKEAAKKAVAEAEVKSARNVVKPSPVDYDDRDEDDSEFENEFEDDNDDEDDDSDDDGDSDADDNEDEFGDEFEEDEYPEDEDPVPEPEPAPKKKRSGFDPRRN